MQSDSEVRANAEPGPGDHAAVPTSSDPGARAVWHDRVRD
jgi:hypothetical protein